MPTFLDHLPQGVSYPDTDPYIQELNRRMPSTQFDRYLPSETVRRDIEKMRERIAVEDPGFAATMDTRPTFRMGSGCTTRPGSTNGMKSLERFGRNTVPLSD